MLLVFSVSDAFGYINFILKSIQSKDLFHSLDITTTGCWEYLLWLDQVRLVQIPACDVYVIILIFQHSKLHCRQTYLTILNIIHKLEGIDSDRYNFQNHFYTTVSVH